MNIAGPVNPECLSWAQSSMLCSRFIESLISFLCAGRRLAINRANRAAQGDLVTVKDDRPSEKIIGELSKGGMQSQRVNRQATWDDRPDPGCRLGQPFLIRVVEREPSLKLSFDPVGMIREFARYELRYNKMDSIGPGDHQSQ